MLRGILSSCLIGRSAWLKWLPENQSTFMATLRGSVVARRQVSSVLLVLAIGLLAQSNGLSADERSAQDQCDGTDSYVSAVQEQGTRLSSLEISGDELASWTMEDFRNAARTLETAKSEVQALTPPRAAVEAHASLLRLLGGLSQMFDAMSVGGLFAALAYTDAIDAASEEFDRTALAFEETCDIAFVDNDEDGAPEVGSGRPAPTSAERGLR
jgi:hypothetical protein